jgi:hypothetical protein
VKVIIEGEEETGSENLWGFVAENRRRLKADALDQVRIYTLVYSAVLSRTQSRSSRRPLLAFMTRISALPFQASMRMS